MPTDELGAQRVRLPAAQGEKNSPALSAGCVTPGPPCTSSPEHARQRLLWGIRRFQADVFPDRKEAYERVMREGQAPHTLFITCADSRIEPAIITQTQPGEIFVSRNIGNLVPGHGEMMGGISAVIEYAVTALEVQQVVICGHSDCGAMRGLLEPDRVANLPLVRSWLRNAAKAVTAAEALRPADAETVSLDCVIEQNVLLQLSHLRTYPSIAENLASGTLGISGWVYDIARGTVSIYDEVSGQFELASDPVASATVTGEVYGCGEV